MVEGTSIAGRDELSKDELVRLRAKKVGLEERDELPTGFMVEEMAENGFEDSKVIEGFNEG